MCERKFGLACSAVWEWEQPDTRSFLGILGSSCRFPPFPPLSLPIPRAPPGWTPERLWDRKWRMLRFSLKMSTLERQWSDRYTYMYTYMYIGLYIYTHMITQGNCTAEGPPFAVEPCHAMHLHCAVCAVGLASHCWRRRFGEGSCTLTDAGMLESSVSYKLTHHVGTNASLSHPKIESTF